jgi:proteasome assembly chaperone (PAC2) family protein
MEPDIWIETRKESEVKKSIAIVGSSGLRSIGKLVVDKLITEVKAELMAELYSTHLPLIYHTKPSYMSHYSLPGVGGVAVHEGQVTLPKVQFYMSSFPSVIIVKGYHANFAGQYEVAERVIHFLEQCGVRRIIVTAGYGSKTRKICCAATSKDVIDEMREKFKIEVDYVGPFYGFSGLVFGMSKLKNIQALSLFAGTQPNLENPEFPDPDSSDMILDILRQVIEFPQ